MSFEPRYFGADQAGRFRDRTSGARLYERRAQIRRVSLSRRCQARRFLKARRRETDESRIPNTIGSSRSTPDLSHAPIVLESEGATLACLFAGVCMTRRAVKVVSFVFALGLLCADRAALAGISLGQVEIRLERMSGGG